MQIIDYEKLVISVALKYGNTNSLSQQMVLRLDSDMFGELPEHCIIWDVITKLAMCDKQITIPAILQNLDADSIGGEQYLLSLFDYAKMMKIESPDDWESYVKVVFAAGKLRQLKMVIDKSHRQFDDFESVVANCDNVEETIFNVLDDIQQIIGTSIQTSYKPISDAVDKEREKLEQIICGKKDFMVIGMPSFEYYGIPYSRSFGVIVGFRSSGKTALAYNGFALGKAIDLQQMNQGGVVAINSLETPDNIIVRRMACCYVGVDSMKIRKNELTELELERYNYGLDFIEKLPIEYDDTPTLTSKELTNKAIVQNLTKKRVLGISDYAELFIDKANRNSNEEQRLSQIAKNIRNIAWTTGSCEILLSQENAEGLKRADKIGGLDNARGSKIFAHATDWGGCIWNPKLLNTIKGLGFVCPDRYNEDKVYFFLQKNKNGEQTGEIEMDWYPEYTRFVDSAVFNHNNIFDFRNSGIVEEIESDW